MNAERVLVAPPTVRLVPRPWAVVDGGDPHPWLVTIPWANADHSTWSRWPTQVAALDAAREAVEGAHWWPTPACLDHQRLAAVRAWAGRRRVDGGYW